MKELISIEDLKKLTNEIACSVPFSYTEQQKLLEELDIKKRYEKLCSELTDEIQIIDVKKEIQKKVKELVEHRCTVDCTPTCVASDCAAVCGGICT